MSALAQGGVMLIAGVIVFRTVLVGGHVNYVRPGLGIPLLLGAAVVALVGISSLWSKLSAADVSGRDHAVGHSHHGPGVGWLLLVPMLALITIPQIPLGSFAAGLGAGRSPVRAAVDFRPLPETTNGAVDLPVSEFVNRALYAPETLEETPVRLVGFVTPDPEAPNGWFLTRFSIGCCAADAFPLKVALLNDVPRAADEWLEVGIYRPTSGQDGEDAGPPQLGVVEARSVPLPENPYEY